MAIKIYMYEKCSTCKTAIKFLESKKIRYVAVPIVESPPTKQELTNMLSAYGGELKKLFNTSGELYREFKLCEKVKDMKASEAVELLSKHGKLIKRPFLVGDGHMLVGFKEDVWKKEFQ